MPTTLCESARQALPFAQDIPPRSVIVRRWRDELSSIEAEHRPSSFPAFSRLAALPQVAALDPDFLGGVHLLYQTAMHATRAAVYCLPHLDSPALRQRKLRILVDDDGLPDGGTHHYQLTAAFRRLGAHVRLDDESFGDLDMLCRQLDPRLANYVRTVKTLYARSLGPWCIVEKLSDDWMRALAGAFAAHAPSIIDEPYFAECFDHGVEERHAEESLEITESILCARPELLEQNLRDARSMARALDSIWILLDEQVCAAGVRAA